MRHLFILYGAPGSGKSTLVRTLYVEAHTLGYDMFRPLFAPIVPCADGEGESLSARISPHAGRLVASACLNALDARMETGETLFFDATSVKVGDQKALVKRARAHAYTPHIIDVQGDLSLDELRERNVRRGAKSVDDEVLEHLWTLGAAKQFAPGVDVISGSVSDIAARVAEITSLPAVLGADEFVVVGDVHSSSVALDKAVESLDAPGRHWVFTGDLFDRGPDPVGVWRTVTRLMGEGRATVVTGNHEQDLLAVNTHTSNRQMPEARATRNLLAKAGITPDQQVAFVAGTVPAAFLPGDNWSWLVTHGGVGLTTLNGLSHRHLVVSDAECVWGLNPRAATWLGDATYDVKSVPLSGRQFHGHRSGVAGGPRVARVRWQQDGPIVCLDPGDDAGRLVAAAVYAPTQGLIEVREFVDPDVPARRPAPKSPEEREPLLERMESSPHIKVRPVEGFPVVVACNFTRKAFQEGAWDDLTMHARGLFLDEETGEVLARGYEKFFHVGEEPGRSEADWENHAVWPVIARKKYNGYLTLVASVHGRLAVFSKSGVTPYSQVAEAMLIGMLGEEGCEQLRAMLERTKATAVFECIRHDDPHPIVEAGGDRLVLLDVIANEEAFRTLDKVRDGIAARFHVDCAETIGVARDVDQFRGLVESVHERSDEGAVLIDATGYRSKVKTDLYTGRKAPRAALERVWHGKADTLGPRWTDLEERLREAGLWGQWARYEVASVGGAQRFDLARLFEDLEVAV